MLQPPQLRTAILAFQPLGVSGALSLPVYQSLDWLVLAIRYRSQNRQSPELLFREVSEGPVQHRAHARSASRLSSDSGNILSSLLLRLDGGS